jgi:PRD1 phage membrane DNA delivery
MSSEVIQGIVTVLTAIVVVAIIAVLVSKNANTAGVLQAGGQAFSTSLGAAVAPVTGGSLGFTGGMPLSNIQAY